MAYFDFAFVCTYSQLAKSSLLLLRKHQCEILTKCDVIREWLGSVGDRLRIVPCSFFGFFTINRDIVI